jgi:hypothetical protein
MRPILRNHEPPSLSPTCCSARNHTSSSWLDLAEGRLRLDRLAATAGAKLSSPGRAAHSSRDKKVFRAPSSAALRSASGCVADRLRHLIAIEAAVVAGSKTEWRIDMANIGSFKKSGTELPRPTAPTTTPPATGFTSVARRSGQPGRSGQATAATTFRSSWMTRASTRRSLPTCSRTKTVRVTRSSGPAPARPTASKPAGPKPPRPVNPGGVFLCFVLLG